MKRAWEMVKATGKRFDVCLAKAWTPYRLKKAMLKGIVKFAYEKVDGSLRVAYGTLTGANYTPSAKETKERHSTFNYFDTEAKAFRSFKIENLITVY